MKAKFFLLTGLISGVVIGWAFAFLGLPSIEKNFLYLLGFVTCLAFISLAVMFLFAWNQRALLRTLIGKSAEPVNAIGASETSLLMICVFGITTMVTLAGGFALYRKNASLRILNENHSKKMNELSELLESVKKNNNSFSINKILSDTEKALENNKGSMLSNSVIASITTLSSLCKPYRTIEGDSLSEKKLSPERGQLLTGLCLLQMDSASFTAIKQQVSFSFADLKKVNLKGINLSGADLKGANLHDADLSGANLSEANLQEANFWGANLNDANLHGANLNGANLNWAVLNGATLQAANLNGASLSNAQFRNANLDGAALQWVKSEALLFDSANLTRVDFTGAVLSKANLSGATMHEADLRRVNLSEANLAGAELSKAVVEENWFEKLREWRLTGAKAIQENFKVVNDSTDKWNKPVYRLKKMEKQAEVK